MSLWRGTASEMAAKLKDSEANKIISLAVVAKVRYERRVWVVNITSIDWGPSPMIQKWARRTTFSPVKVAAADYPAKHERLRALEQNLKRNAGGQAATTLKSHTAVGSYHVTFIASRMRR
jgi:hypothetical protein